MPTNAVIQVLSRTVFIAIALATGCTVGSSEPAESAAQALCSIASVAAAPPSPADPGTQVALTVSPATCGAGETPEYRFAFIRDGVPGLTVIQDWSSSSTAQWDTTGIPSGRYVLYAYVRAQGTTALQARAIYYMIKDICPSTTLGASPGAPQPPGTFVTLGAVGTCTGGSPEYRFLYRRSGETVWKELQPWGSGSAVWNTTGLQPGLYNLLVFVRRVGNTSGSEGVKHLAYQLADGSELVSGMSFSCARFGGSVRCWGNNAYGQQGTTTPDRGLAPGEMGDALPNVQLGTGRTAKSVVTGPHHACAILDTSAVKCWGHNKSGALGLGDANHRSGAELGDALPTVDLGSGRSAVALAAGYDFTCAVLDDGAVKCWGANNHGQLGQGHTNALGDQPNEMGNSLPSVDLGGGRTATAITAGHNHACAVLDDGSVKCWGYNTYHGVLGLGDNLVRGDAPGEMGDSLPAVDLGAGRTATAITAGANHTCALLDDASVKCWGQNSRGQLGLGDTSSRGGTPGQMGDALPAVNLGNGRTATSIASGTSYTCAVLDDGHAKCWGDNRSGQLGLGDTTIRGTSPGQMGDGLPAIDLGTGRTALGIVAGLGTTCARLDNQTLKCWGNNETGTLGLGDTQNRGDGPGEMGDALPAVALGTGATVTAVPRGAPNLYQCALLAGGNVKCWGSNYVGEHGAGPSTSVGDESGELASTVDLGSRTAKAIGAANYQLCALLDDGSVKCMGAGSALLGQGDTLGRGARPATQGDNIPPINLGTGRTAVKLAVGAAHACAILDDNALKCWGSNAYGQLGLGDTNSRGDQAGEMGDALPAVNLGTGRFAHSLFLGGNSSCALLDNGTLKCWGQNNWGRLGLGDTNNRGDGPGEMGDALPAIDLGSGRSATFVAVGHNSMCAVLDNQTLKCWGGGGQGLLGSGSVQAFGDQPGEMGDALPVVDLGSGLTATSVSIGTHHVCVALNNSRVKCWGDAGFGQLGLEDTQDRGDGAGEMGTALPYVNVGGGLYAVGVSAGSYHSCAVFRDDTVKCWGNNDLGQLGLGDNLTRGDNWPEMGNSLPFVTF